MRASTERTSIPSQAERFPLRLQLNGTMGDGTQDGTWWPQTRDVTLELTDLCDNFPQGYGHVERTAVARVDWDAAPSEVQAVRRVVEIDFCPSDTSRQVLLSMSTRREIALVLTPPEEPPSMDVDSLRAVSEPDLENGDPDAVLLWTDRGDTWWELDAGAPSDRSENR